MKTEKSNNNFEDRTLDFYTSLKFIFSNNDFIKEKLFLMFVSGLLLVLGFASLIITVISEFPRLGDLNDGNIALFIFFSTISGTIFFINYITNKNKMLLTYVDMQDKILEIVKKNIYLKMLHEYLKNKGYYYNNDYVNRQKEVFFNKNDKRVFEFIYRKDYVQIAVAQTEKLEKLMNKLGTKIGQNSFPFGKTYILIRIPYDKLNDELVSDIKKIIDETLK